MRRPPLVVFVTFPRRPACPAARSGRRAGRPAAAGAAVDGDERAVVVRRVGGVAVRDAADLEVVDADAALTQQGEHGLHAHGVRVLNVEREIGALAREPGLQPHEHHLDQQHDGRGEDGTLGIARAADKADDGRGPESGGGGQTLDALGRA